MRTSGIVLASLGMLVLLWSGIAVWRGDPLTSLYTRYEQHRLATRLAIAEEQPLPGLLAVTPVGGTAADRRRARAAASRRAAVAYDRSLRDGDPIGRIVVARLHLNMVVLQGTTTSDLEQGPGHYDAASGAATALPGMGGTIAIAGHRTTFLHPFRHIDALRTGDRVSLVMPYGTFDYVVFRHAVVSSTDWSIVRRRPFEELVLSACHPLYSATHRWVVFARLVGRAPARAA